MKLDVSLECFNTLTVAEPQKTLELGLGSDLHTKCREAQTGLLRALLFVSIGLNISEYSVPTPTPESNLGAPEGMLNL